MTYLFPNKGITALFQQGGYFFLIVIVIDFISLNQAIINANNFAISHTPFRTVC